MSGTYIEAVVGTGRDFESLGCRTLQIYHIDLAASSGLVKINNSTSLVYSRRYGRHITFVLFFLQHLTMSTIWTRPLSTAILQKEQNINILVLRAMRHRIGKACLILGAKCILLLMEQIEGPLEWIILPKGFWFQDMGDKGPQRRCLFTVGWPGVEAAKALTLRHAWPKRSSICCISGFFIELLRSTTS